MLQINLGDAMALIFSSPVFTIIFEWVFVAKPRGIAVKLPISLFLIFGVVLIIQPPFLRFESEANANATNAYLNATFGSDGTETSLSNVGICSALGAAIIGGVCNVAAWYTTSDRVITPVVLTAYSGLTGLIMCLLIGLIFSDT